MKNTGWVVSGFCLTVLLLCAPAAYSASPDNGSFGSYLIGTFDQREGYTVVQIVNPTATAEGVCVALFDVDGTALIGKNFKIASNGLVEVSVKTFELKAKVGVVKVVVRESSGTPGVAGFQRFYSGRMGIAVESNLASVPLDATKGEYEKIVAVCKKR